MQFPDLEAMIDTNRKALRDGASAIIVVEDDVEVDTTLRHHQQAGFANVIALMPEGFTLAKDLQESILRVTYDVYQAQALEQAVNRIIEAAPGQWLYYCYNAEFLFYPFSESRSVPEMLAFHSQERRDAMLAYVIDLYADDLDRHPDAVCLDRAHLDRSGYYAQARAPVVPDQPPPERQLDFFGGLRWRYEEHIAPTRRRIDRVALFRAREGLRMNADHTFNEPEYNTYACPWHNNITAAVCSFRTAKALKTNPGSSFDIQTFNWHNSVPFEWHSRQLMDLGLMEPGQWF